MHTHAVVTLYRSELGRTRTSMRTSAGSSFQLRTVPATTLESTDLDDWCSIDGHLSVRTRRQCADFRGDAGGYCVNTRLPFARIIVAD